MASRFDVSAWNLAMPTCMLMSACGPLIQLDDGESDVDGGSTTTTGSPSTVSTTAASVNPTLTTMPSTTRNVNDTSDTGILTCYDQPCPPGFECRYGECQPYGYGEESYYGETYCASGGYGYEPGYRCYNYEYYCYSQYECAPDSFCFYDSEQCEPVVLVEESCPDAAPPIELIPPIPLSDAISLAFADANSDNVDDLLVLSRSGFRVVEGPDFTGSTGQAGNFTSATEFVPIDLEPDGDADLAIQTSGGLQIWVNNGFASFTLGPTLPERLSQLHTGDVNGDGIADIIALRDNQLVVLEGTGLDAFTSFARNIFGDRLTVADFDRDDFSDAVVQSDEVLYFLRGVEGLNVIETEVFGTFPGSLLSGDVTGDSVADLMTVSNGFPTRVVLYPDTGLGGRRLGPSFPVDIAQSLTSAGLLPTPSVGHNRLLLLGPGLVAELPLAAERAPARCISTWGLPVEIVLSHAQARDGTFAVATQTDVRVFRFAR